MMRLQSKFTEYLLAPANALYSGVEGEYLTTDNIRVMAFLDTVWNNAEGYYDDELDRVCEYRFKCPFRFIRSIWIGRLGSVSDYWHLIKLKKI